MKNQTNTTTEYRHSNLNSNKYYKRFLLKAVSMIAIPIMTVSMLPNFALADDMNTANENVNYSNLIDTQNLSQTAQDIDSTHTISVNLSTIEMENPYQSVKLNDDSPIPEPTNDVTVYNIEAESVQYDNSSTAEIENDSQIETETKTESQPTSTYRYANLVHLTDSERKLVYDILANEVGSASYRDKLLVAEAFYNGLIYNNCSPKTLAKGQYDAIRTGYDAFKQDCIRIGVEYYKDIEKAVTEVFDNYNMPYNDDFILFFHSGRSSWHENAKTIYLVENTGAHKYYALKSVPEINYTR
jgi:hypothetical protein